MYFKMFPEPVPILYLVVLSLFTAVQASLFDKSTVGPLTSLSSKSKVCNVLDYGGVADNETDVGPAIKLAFSSCVVGGDATLYIPPGSYSSKSNIIQRTCYSDNN